MKQTTYELLALLDRTLRDSVALLKRITTCPGQRSDVLMPLMNEVQYVRAQVGFEITSEAHDYEQTNQMHWSRIHNRYMRWLKDPDDVFFEAEQREKERKKLGLPPRIIVLPWDSEKEEKLLAARRTTKRTGRKKKSKSIPCKAARRANTA